MKAILFIGVEQIDIFLISHYLQDYDLAFLDTSQLNNYESLDFLKTIKFDWIILHYVAIEAYIKYRANFNQAGNHLGFSRFICYSDLELASQVKELLKEDVNFHHFISRSITYEALISLIEHDIS